MRAERLHRSWLVGILALGSALSLWSLLRRTGAVILVSPDRLRRVGLLAVGALLFASASAAQEPPSDSLEIVIPAPDPTIGGIARYDGGGRRDPFVPLLDESGGGMSGPRLEQLKLTGIFMGSGANSLVVLEDPTHRGHFVRLGQPIGSARLVEILPQAAVFEVNEYGASRRVILRLARTEERP